MDTRSIAIAVLSTGLWLGTIPPAHAQIASISDGSGRRVFVNANFNPTQRPAVKSIASRIQPAAIPTASPLPPDVLENLVQQSAQKHGLDPALLRAVIGVESGGNPVAVSRKGALGLMQLIPATAERFGVGNVFDPAQNVEAGAKYLRELLDRYNGDLTKTLAAYNAGEGAVERSGGMPNYPETRSYVRKVTKTYFQPGSVHLSGDGSAPSLPVRKVVDEHGRVVYTNE